MAYAGAISIQFVDGSSFTDPSNTREGVVTLTDPGNGDNVSIEVDGLAPTLVFEGIGLGRIIDEALAVRNAYQADPSTASTARLFESTDEQYLTYDEDNDTFSLQREGVGAGVQGYSAEFLLGLQQALDLFGY